VRDVMRGRPKQKVSAADRVTAAELGAIGELGYEDPRALVKAAPSVLDFPIRMRDAADADTAKRTLEARLNTLRERGIRDPAKLGPNLIDPSTEKVCELLDVLQNARFDAVKIIESAPWIARVSIETMKRAVAIIEKLDDPGFKNADGGKSQ